LFRAAENTKAKGFECLRLKAEKLKGMMSNLGHMKPVNPQNGELNPKNTYIEYWIRNAHGNIGLRCNIHQERKTGMLRKNTQHSALGEEEN